MGFRRNRYRVAAVVALALVTAPAPAYAFKFLGMTFFESKTQKDQDVIGTPLHYDVTVETQPEDRALTKAVRNASGLYADRKKPASGAAGLVAKAKADYKTILAALYNEARYGGTIHILINGREADSLPPDAKIADNAKVDIRVSPGPLFVFGRTAIVNRAPPPTTYRDRVPLPEDIGFRPGEPAKAGVVLQTEKLATAAWAQQGHAKAKVTDRKVVADHATNTVNVTITVDPGSVAYYGVVAVKGARRMDPAFVARQTDLKPGEEYDPDDIKRANDRLTKLDVFQALNIEQAETLGPDGQMPITVHVRERKLHRFGVGATYSTIDGAGLSAFWLHRNLFGHAESLRFDGKVGGLGDSADPTAFDYSLGATYTQPGTFDPDTDLIAAVLGQRQVLEHYTENSVDGRVGLAHEFTPELSGSIFTDLKWGRFEDDLGTRDFLTFGFPATLDYDTRDTKTDATQGVFLEGTAEPFYEFEFGNPALRATAEARGYYGIGVQNRLVLAGRVKVGSLVGSSIGETPPDKLFFAGGGGSVRGYAYQGIGVRHGDIVTGGRSLFETSAEARVKITNTIGVVAFADAGTVGESSFIDFAEPLKVGAGAGLRYYTGLGPIRLDAAVPLNPEPGDPSFSIYVGIGQAF
ncbi:MAG: autotransporter assembly complex protein TamA [Pararhizobium sp.]